MCIFLGISGVLGDDWLTLFVLFFSSSWFCALTAVRLPIYFGWILTA